MATEKIFHFPVASTLAEAAMLVYVTRYDVALLHCLHNREWEQKFARAV